MFQHFYKRKYYTRRIMKFTDVYLTCIIILYKIKHKMSVQNVFFITYLIKYLLCIYLLYINKTRATIE